MKIEDYVVALYRLLLHREPDASGLEYWVDIIKSTGDYSKVFEDLLNSAEYRDSIQATSAGQPGSLPNSASLAEK